MRSDPAVGSTGRLWGGRTGVRRQWLSRGLSAGDLRKKPAAAPVHGSPSVGLPFGDSSLVAVRYCLVKDAIGYEESQLCRDAIAGTRNPAAHTTSLDTRSANPGRAPFPVLLDASPRPWRNAR